MNVSILLLERVSRELTNFTTFTRLTLNLKLSQIHYTLCINVWSEFIHGYFLVSDYNTTCY